MGTISAGTLPGQVAGLNLVNTLAAAQAAEAAVQTANTADVTALVAKLAAPTTFADGTAATATATDGLATNATYAQKVTAITTDAKAFRDKVSTDSTTVLTTKASDAATAVETARAALTADAKTKATTYEASIKANAALTAAKPADVAAVKAGLDADTAFTSAVIAKAAAVDSSITDADSLYSFYVDGTTTAAQRSTLDAALKDVPYLATFKATATVDVAKNSAIKAEADAKIAIDAADPATGTGEFSAVLKASTDAAALVVKATAADADVAAVKVITDANKVAHDATLAAGTAISDFNGDYTTAQIKTIVTGNASDTVNETFYFAAKPDGATDFTIGATAANTQFAAGDAIVLGSSYTYNSGALSTGNNNALEFFLVKTDTGTQVVVEGTVFASASVTADASTGVATAADSVAVINLVGVTPEHLSVANGVISYV